MRANRVFRKIAGGVMVGAAFAGALTCSPASATITQLPAAEISAIATRAGGQTSLFLLNTSFASSDGCPGDRGAFESTEPGADTMLAAAMLAFSLGKTVDIAVDGCVPLAGSTTLIVPRIVKVRVLR